MWLWWHPRRRCRVPGLAGGPGPAAQEKAAGKGHRAQGGTGLAAAGRMRGGRERGFGDASVTLPLPRRLPLPSTERQHPCVRSLTSVGDARPQPPARSVCFLSHFAKRLLILFYFFFHKEPVAAKGRTGQSSLRQEMRPAANSSKRPSSKHERSNKPTQATGGNHARAIRQQIASNPTTTGQGWSPPPTSATSWGPHRGHQCDGGHGTRQVMRGKSKDSCSWPPHLL